MRSRLSLLVVLLAASPVLAQFPSIQKFGKWNADGAVRKAAADAVVPAESKKVIEESGLASVGTVGAHDGNGDRATIAVYQFKDSSGAYQAFSFLRPADGELLANDARHAIALGKENAVLLRGNYVAVLDKAAGISGADLEELSGQLGAVAERVPFPPIPSYMPDAGRVGGSEHYALGPVAYARALEALGAADIAPAAGEVGFPSGAEAMLAKYANGKSQATLLLIEYPTPQLAEQHLRHMQQLTGAGIAGTGISAERKASLLAVVLHPSSNEYAKQLRSSVNFETQVTWNEPTHIITDPPITTTLSKIIIGTGVFMLVAMVLGVAFGGVRIVTKLLFPGKVFDRPEQMDVLQLGLSRKGSIREISISDDGRRVLPEPADR